MKVAFITGIAGQDGSYLAELLLSKNYQVYGIIRRSSTINTDRIDHIFNNENLHIHYGDLIDMAGLLEIFQEMEKQNPSVIEVYNLAAQSHVKVSFDIPIYTSQTNCIGTLNLLEIIRKSSIKQKYKFYQASTSEMFGDVLEIPQSETTPFNPQSPYAVSKLYCHWITKNYRDAYNIFACTGILFNHEGERRGETFVTRKITIATGKIEKGEQDFVTLGNIDAKRDWGHAKDFVYGMYLMLQHDKPDDYVLATGEQHTVREFIEIAFSHIDMKITWEGEGVNEIGKDQNGNIRVKINPKYFRPTEVETLLGDSSKAKNTLGWKHKISFKELVKRMVTSDSL